MSPVSATSDGSSGTWVTVTHGGKTYKVWRPRPVTTTPPVQVDAGPARGSGRRQAMPAEAPLPATFPAPAEADLEVARPVPKAASTKVDPAALPSTLPVTVTLPPIPGPQPNASGTTGSSGPTGSSGATTPAPTVHITLTDHTTALAAGVTGLLASVARTDSGGATPVQVSLSYASIIGAYGGGFGDRLKLVALPSCALTTPTVPACRVQTPVAYTNDRAGQNLVATVQLPAGPVAAGTMSSDAMRTDSAKKPAPGTGVVLAATSGSSGQSADYTATPLKASDNWSANTGGNAGSFGWDYPISVPAALGGAAPSLSLNYDSASVDGRTTVENGQVSVVGEGWDLAGTGSAITRTLQPCAVTNSASWGTSHDNCVGTPNAALVGGSHSGDLVRDDADTTTPGGKWRIQADDGARVQLLYGVPGSNGTADGAYWQVTDTDGTVWLYGADRLPQTFGGTGADTPTYSAWAEPVFGQGSALSGACNDPTTQDPAKCLGAWRWNLSFKIDPHRNVTRYTYAREFNGYQHTSNNSTLTKPTAYTRGGVLREIDYGWRTDELKTASGLLADGTAAGPKPAATVIFDMAARCLATTGCPAASAFTVQSGGLSSGITYGTGGNSGSFVDTPTDQYCDYSTPTTPCTSAALFPTFWSTVRLTGIHTAVAAFGFTPNATQQAPGTPAGYVSVDKYKFPEQFPALNHAGTCTGCARPNLWLAEIDHTGYTTNADRNGNPGGATLSADMPPVYTYGNDDLPNRAGISQLISQGVLDRYRMYELTDEFGSEISVTYGQKNPGGADFTCPTAPTPATNTTLCFPEFLPDPNNPSGKLTDWFNKYVVTGVTEFDNTGVSPSRNANYTYLGTPAWHTNDSEQVQSKYRTYDQFRGFGQVQKVTGSQAAGGNHMVLTTYFRGMDADPTALYSLTSSVQSTHPSYTMRDDNALAGQIFETESFASDASALTDPPVTDAVALPVDPRGIITASHVRPGLPTQNAHFSHTAKKYTYTASGVPGVGVRKSEVDYGYADSSGVFLPDFTGNGVGNNGELLTVDDLGDNSAPGAGDGTAPETCTFTSYAGAGSNDRLQWTSYPAFAVSSVVPKGTQCSTTSWTPATVLSMTQTFYDGATYSGVLNGPGDVTASQVAKGFTSGGSAVWVTGATTMSQSDIGHDVYGRATRAVDNMGRTTTTAYNPPTGALPVVTTVTTPAGWTTTTTTDQGRDLSLHSVDINGQIHDEDYDGLGRAAAVWVPGHSKAANPSQPNYKLDDHLFGTLPRRLAPGGGLSTSPYTHTATLREDGSYADTYGIADGYGRTVQTQTVTADNEAGRLIADTAYDSLGRVSQTLPTFAASGAPSPIWTNWPLSPPSASTTTFDGLDRPLVSSVYSTDPTGHRTPVSTTTNVYKGMDWVDTTPPTGGTATTTVSDARGRPSTLWQYRGAAAPTDVATDADVTTYTYGYASDPLTGSQPTKTVADAPGNVWTTTADLLGRTVAAQDPDTGASVSAYDDSGNLLGTADGRGRVLAYSYGSAAADPLRRKNADYDGGTIAGYGSLSSNAARISALNTALGSATTTANEISSFTYDKSLTNTAVPNARGQLTAATRYTAGGNGPAYVTGVSPTLGFGSDGKPIGTFTTIPNADGNGALAGTYSTTNYYTPLTGLLDHTDLTAGPGTTAAGFAPETVYNLYNINGLLLTSGGNADYMVDTTFDPTGRVTTRTLGDYPYQLVQSQLYDPVTGRVTKSFLDGSAGAGTGGALNKYSVDYTTYTYNPAGRITSTSDLQNSSYTGYYPGAPTTDLQCFTYDGQGRLTNTWTDNGGTTPAATPVLDDSNGAGPAPGGVGHCTANVPGTPAAGKSQTTGAGPAPYWQSFTVDAAGDRSGMVDHDITSGTNTGDVSRSYNYKNASGGQPHTLARVDTTAGGTTTPTSYGYDASGNTTIRPGSSGAQNLTWNAEGRVSHVDANGSTADYVYTASGGQLLRRDSSNHITTLYIGSLELKLNTSNNTVTGLRFFSYPDAPTIVVDQAGTVTYEATNDQGTAATTISAGTGKILGRRYTTPFGTARGGAQPAWPDDHTFLGKTADASTGLVDVGARKYDPATGRFLSGDPVFQGGNPQTIGGYAYAGNDPIDFSDPSGLTRGDMCHENGGHMNAGTCVYDDPSATSSDTSSDDDDDTSDGWGDIAPGAAALPGRYGNKSSRHDAARDTAIAAIQAQLAAARVDQYDVLTTLRVPGAKKKGFLYPNSKPQAAGDGVPDIVIHDLKSDVYYVWEVKSAGSADKAYTEAAWYVGKMRAAGDKAVVGWSIGGPFTSSYPGDIVVGPSSGSVIYGRPGHKKIPSNTGNPAPESPAKIGVQMPAAVQPGPMPGFYPGVVYQPGLGNFPLSHHSTASSEWWLLAGAAVFGAVAVAVSAPVDITVGVGAAAVCGASAAATVLTQADLALCA